MAAAAAGPLKRARWQEEDTLASYRMLSLHQMFELVGSQLSRADVEALSFLLAEAYPLQRALRAGEEMEAEEGAAADDAVPGPRAPAPAPAWDEPGCCSSGVRLLFELERRGLCDETNFRHLLQLLRVISRHDLLPYVGCNRGRAVSPERSTCRGPVSRVGEQVESCLNSERAVSMQSGWEPGASLTKRHTATRRIRGSDIRLRVRAVYSDQNTVLRGNVVSVKQDPLDRCFDLFGQANTILKSRDLGSIICDIKFSELSYLDAFWNDYINGSLLEALKGVFITDSLKQAVGQEAIQLLVNVDEDDYEKGRRVLQNICP